MSWNLSIRSDPLHESFDIVCTRILILWYKEKEDNYSLCISCLYDVWQCIVRICVFDYTKETTLFFRLWIP